MKRSLISLLFFLTLLLLSCDKRHVTQKQIHGYESSVLFAKSLQRALDIATKITNGKGISACVIIPDKGTWTGVSGISHPNTPISPDMLFDIASIGKNFLATLVLQLCEEGKLSLDDPINLWLADHPNIANTITIRQLLNHTSGIFDFVEHPKSPFRIPFNSIDFGKASSHEYILEKLIDKPYFPPGTGWHYSTTNYILLRMIVEEEIRSSVSQELENRFIKPLGLTHTVILDEKATTIPLNLKLAHSWFDVGGNGALDDITSKPKTWMATISPAMFFSTAEDLAKWSQALYGGELIDKALLSEMLTFYHPTPGEPGTGYGLGTVEIRYGGIETWGHLGWQYGCTSAMLYIPEDSASLTLLINDNNIMFINFAFFAIWLVIKYHLSPFLFVIVLISIMSLILMFLFWPIHLVISLVRFTKTDKSTLQKNHSKTGFVIELTAFMTAILVLLPIILYFLYTINPQTPLSWNVGNLYVKSILILSYLSALLSILMIIFTVIVWKRAYWSLLGRIHFAFVTFAVFVMIRFLISWNILL